MAKQGIMAITATLLSIGLIATAYVVFTYSGEKDATVNTTPAIPVTPDSSPLTQQATPTPETPPANEYAPSSSPAPELVEPVALFSQRITKKPFGIHITPATSLVQPERFSGYHTGVDIEYADINGDVPVYAITDGTVLLSRQASGYGGVVAIRHQVNGESVVAIYGHLDPAVLPATGDTVTKGEQIGILGEGNSPETDGERKHLHFAIHKDTQPDIRGYVSSQAELEQWLASDEVEA